MRIFFLMLVLLLNSTQAFGSACENRLSFENGKYTNIEFNSINYIRPTNSQWSGLNLVWSSYYELIGLVKKYQYYSNSRLKSEEETKKILDKIMHMSCRLRYDLIHYGNDVWTVEMPFLNELPTGETQKPAKLVMAAGLVGYPIATAVKLFQELDNKNGTQEYLTISNELIRTLENVISSFDSNWNSQVGMYQSLPKTSTYVIDDSTPPRPFSDAKQDPKNMVSIMGQLLLEMVELTKDENLKRNYLRKAHEIAYNIKKSFLKDGNAVIWPYWQWPNNDDGYIKKDDASHGVFVVDFVLTAYEKGVVFDIDDIKALVETFNKNIFPDKDEFPNYWVDGKLPPFLDPLKDKQAYIEKNGTHVTENAKYSTWNAYWLWAILIPYERQNFTNPMIFDKLKALDKKIVTSASDPDIDIINLRVNDLKADSVRYLANVYSEIFKEQKPYGANCDFNIECQSNICFNGKVCGDPLGKGSTCYKDKECITSVCSNNKCLLRNQKPYGSQCRDDIECESGICFANAVCGNALGVSSTCNRDKECQNYLICGLKTTKPIQLSCIYPNNKSYGFSCLRDDECVSGICFNKHRIKFGEYIGGVCGDPLGVDSTCYETSECQSGLVCEKQFGLEAGLCNIQ